MAKKSSLVSWLGAIIIVVAGGYYFLKVRPAGQEQQIPTAQQLYGSSTTSQAVENIGSRRVAFPVRRRIRGRVPKIKKLRRR